MSSIPDGRIRVLNSHPTQTSGSYVLYWMQAAQRVSDNPALTFATERANALGKPLVVVFCVMPHFPEASLRHFTFVLEGLTETFEALRGLGALALLRVGQGAKQVSELGREACEVVCDRGYLSVLRSGYAELVKTLNCRLTQIEGEAVVPVEAASTKSEYAARTIRPRITRHLNEYLREVPTPTVQTSPAELRLDTRSGSLEDISGFLKELGVDNRVRPVSEHFQGGPGRAKKLFADFLAHRVGEYNDSRNQPQLDGTSLMSPYLHYGMISPVALALKVLNASSKDDPQAESYLEELVIRRGLSQNFCHFNQQYDHYRILPDWARKTLGEHQDDPRPHLYSPEQLEAAATHDPYWNASQVEMVETGYMHNYMRMYWGKKILEWSESPEVAYDTTLRLNNRYFLDGRDPVSFANVAWIFGLHDRAWQERAIYGKIRCMMASGLERKSDPKAYIAKVEERTGRAVEGQSGQGRLSF